MLKKVLCGNCNKEIDVSMEIEYSDQINEFFCSPDCATNRYFEYMGSSFFDVTDKGNLEKENIKIIKGKLYFKED
ncbi:hypothetical protein MX569_03100 [Anoxybacillus kestanbolensis]|uniref:hypothetical protein n=1 Tax=Anoxybacillus kestanbolensis TaxID=227476 RepID=UPI00208DD510|nr:hypothetical protein [Anoxybacillus kestanbolensis]MCL9969576.1 hypothetical protein [Anoxybacillus kestanbolensis]